MNSSKGPRAVQFYKCSRKLLWPAARTIAQTYCSHRLKTRWMTLAQRSITSAFSAPCVPPLWRLTSTASRSHGAAAAASPPQPRRTSGLAVHFAPLTPSPTNAASSPPTAEWILPSLRSQLIRQRGASGTFQRRADSRPDLETRQFASFSDKTKQTKVVVFLGGSGV